MADEPKTQGALGRLPQWPRAALNPSVIAAEQAYRKRSGLPLLSDADMEALKSGVQMSWEGSNGSGSSASTAPQESSATAAAVAAAVPPTAAVPASVGTGSSIGAEVAALVAQGKKWSKSAIAAEQARRKRKSLPELTEAEVFALLGEAPPESVTPASSGIVTSAPPPVPSSPTGPLSDEVKAQVALGKKWSKSAIAAEQARRKRKDLPLFTDAEVAALLGEAAQVAPPTPVATAATAVPSRAVAASAPAGNPVARSGASTTYVGTPAVGTSKAAAAGGVASVGPEDNSVNRSRRRLVWSCVVAFLAAWFLAFFRFFLPRTLFEPATSFKIGYPADYGLGVDTKWQQKYRIWVDRTPDRMFVIYARCTHLGCTPDWKPSENKFKCPCHGSGYDSEGINFEGPAPRPMDRAHVELAPDGQILVDVSKLYQWPKGQPSQFGEGDGTTGAWLRA